MIDIRTLQAKEVDVCPPNSPWMPLCHAKPEQGCLSFYLSDELSRLPVRAVTLPANNKSDPNPETGTYGLFSTCERQMRSSIVKRSLRYILFVTRWEGGRVLTGYYRVRWYCDGAFAGERSDYALAADRTRFIDPIPLKNLPAGVRKVATTRFRTFRLLSAVHTRALVDLIDASPDRTAEYLEEIDRLERFNSYHTGYRCWGRKEPFSWEAAVGYLRPDKSRQWSTSAAIPNTSPTNHWRCEACRAIIRNKALLKSCPLCGALGALRPAASEEVSEIG